VISDNALLKGGLVIAVLWGLWFRKTESATRDKEVVLAGIIIATLALFFARFLALTLPFRERPLHAVSLHFSLPAGENPEALIGWSSFPSDHAVLFFSLATSIYFVSRKLGFLAFCHAAVVVCFPRVYLGYHYPTDILVGAVLGIGFACLTQNDDVRALLTRRALLWLERAPASFYSCFYLCTFLMAVNFDPVRHLISFLRHVVLGHY